MRLFLSDIDRTIMPWGATVVPERVREAFRFAREQGCVAGLSTGRSYVWASTLFEGDEACYATSVTTNGLEIYHNGELIVENRIPIELCHRVAELVRGVDHAGFVWFDGKQPMLAEGTKEDLLVAFPRYGKICTPATLPGHDILKVNPFVGGDLEATQALKDLLEREVPELDFDVPQAGFINTMPKGWNKGSAVLYLRDYLGIDEDDVFVFGDAENDLTMLGAVKNSVAVSNATPAAAAAARWHIGSCDDFAVADAVEALARGEFPFTE